MNELFHRFDGDEPGELGWPKGWLGEAGSYWPSVDVADDVEAVTVTAELPGIDDKNVDVSMTGDMLTIRGEKKDEREEKGKNYYRTERSFGSFTRSLRLPCEIVPDKIRATFKNGVLTVNLPKAASELGKTKRIEIKST